MPLPVRGPISLKGSPTSAPPTARIIIHAHLTPELRERIALLAVEQGRSFASFVREGLEAVAEKYERGAVRR